MLGHFVLGPSHAGKRALTYLKSDLEILKIEWLLIWITLLIR